MEAKDSIGIAEPSTAVTVEGSGGGNCDQDQSSVSGGSGSYGNEDQRNSVWWLQGSPAVQWGS